MYEIDFYFDSNGKSPVSDYIVALSKSHQKNDRAILKKIIHQLDLLQDLGPLLKEPQVKFIKGYKHPLMELRPQPERIFYASWNKNRYILLHHYSKKKNRTDPREAHIAINRLDDWLQRH